MYAVREVLTVLREKGTTLPVQDRLLTWQERQGIVGLPKWQELEKKYLTL
jgi:hypothetical protein